LPTHAGNDRASYGFGAQTGRCAPGPVPSSGRESARPGAGEQWQREVLLAAFAAPVRQRKVDGGVGLQDGSREVADRAAEQCRSLGLTAEVLLPAAPADSCAVRVEQGVPRQAKQAVEISQDHWVWWLSGWKGWADSRRATEIKISPTSAPVSGSAVTAGNGASEPQKIKTSISRSRVRSGSAGRVASQPITA